MAIEIVDLPIETGASHWFSIVMLVYQRVYQLFVSWFPGACPLAASGTRSGELYPGDVDAAGGARPRRICQGEGGGTIRPLGYLGWSFRGFLWISWTSKNDLDDDFWDFQNLWLVIQSTCESGCSKVGFMWCYYDFWMFFLGMTDGDSTKNW